MAQSEPYPVFLCFPPFIHPMSLADFVPWLPRLAAIWPGYCFCCCAGQNSTLPFARVAQVRRDRYGGWNELHHMIRTLNISWLFVP